MDAGQVWPGGALPPAQPVRQQAAPRNAGLHRAAGHPEFHGSPPPGSGPSEQQRAVDQTLQAAATLWPHASPGAGLLVQVAGVRFLDGLGSMRHVLPPTMTALSGTEFPPPHEPPPPA